MPSDDEIERYLVIHLDECTTTGDPIVAEIRRRVRLYPLAEAVVAAARLVDTEAGGRLDDALDAFDAAQKGAKHG